MVQLRDTAHNLRKCQKGAHKATLHPPPQKKKKLSPDKPMVHDLDTRTTTTTKDENHKKNLRHEEADMCSHT